MSARNCVALFYLLSFVDIITREFLFVCCRSKQMLNSKRQVNTADLLCLPTLVWTV